MPNPVTKETNVVLEELDSNPVIEQVHSVTTLRSGKQVDKTIGLPVI